EDGSGPLPRRRRRRQPRSAGLRRERPGPGGVSRRRTRSRLDHREGGRGTARAPAGRRRAHHHALL
ncbi:MAG: hypothetical protein AVDCRST_MAG22-1983, partial [uncultured Rubrobacteraceae bacterium]